MSAGTWRLAKERVETDGRTVRLYARNFTPEGKPLEFRRVLERSRAGTDPKDQRGPAWCVVEYCHRHEDGTLSPWRQE